MGTKIRNRYAVTYFLLLRERIRSTLVREVCYETTFVLEDDGFTSGRILCAERKDNATNR